MPKLTVKRRWSVVFACLACVLLGASRARGVPTWLSPASLSEAGQNAGSPSVAVDAQGDAVAIWDRFDGSDYIIQAAVKPAGGTWQTPVDLSETGQESGTPRVVLDPQGEAIAVWSSGANRTVQAAVRPAGGAWSAPVDLGEGEVATPEPHVAVDSQGNAVVVWVHHQDGQQVIQSALRSPGGAWSAPVAISHAGGGTFFPDVAINPQGEAIATWWGGQFVEAAVKPAGGAWQAPAEVAEHGLGQAGSPPGPRVAIDPQGDAVVAWSNTMSGSGANHVVQAAVMPAGGSWQTPTELSEARVDASAPHVALDTQDNATVLWSTSSGGGNSLQAATMPAGGNWQTPVGFAETTYSVDPPLEPQIAVNTQGDLVAVWDQLNERENVIQAFTRTAGGTWQTPVNLSDSGRRAYEPQVAVDPRGNAIAVWGQLSGANTVVQAAGYDAGPLLNDFSIPTTGTVGQQLTFSASPLDVWSALGATSWSFGDGASASGTSVTHTYSNPGVYRVILSSADALDNTTSTTATVTITAGMRPIACSCVISRRPVISDAHLAHKRFRVARKSTAITARTPLGTSFDFILSQAAKLKITIKRLRRGRRAITAGMLTRRSELPGAHSLPFTGRMGHRALHPGLYRAILKAQNSNGHSQPVTLIFRVLR